MKKLLTYFTKGELLLWGLSTGLILLFFLLFDRENYLTLAASLLGAAALIFTAKGNPLGQFLMILFGILPPPYLTGGNLTATPGACVIPGLRPLRHRRNPQTLRPRRAVWGPPPYRQKPRHPCRACRSS